MNETFVLNGRDYDVEVNKYTNFDTNRDEIEIIVNGWYLIVLDPDKGLFRISDIDPDEFPVDEKGRIKIIED